MALWRDAKDMSLVTMRKAAARLLTEPIANASTKDQNDKGYEWTLR